MSGIHLNDLSKIYREQIVEKKDDTYLEPDMKKRQKNNEKARKELAKGPQMKNPHFEEVEVDEAMSSYDRNRKRAAERAAARNAARDAGKTGAVPGVGYVTPRREKETYVDSAGTTRHKSGAKMEGLDPVGQEDGDINNDGKKDKTDKYLAKRRKAIGNAIKGKMKKEDFIPEVMSDSIDDKPIKEKKVKNVIKVNPKLGESVEEIGGELIEAIEVFDILEEITDQELRFVSDRMIDEVVEEFFIEAAEQDEDLEVLQQNLCESIDLSISLLLEQDAGAEARKRLGSGPSRASVMDRVKSAVKKGAKVARKAVVKGSEVAGKAVGHAKNLAKDMGSAAKKGYQSTQSGSSDSSSSSDSGTSSSSSSAPKKKGPGLLSRIGAKLKRGIGKAARAVSRGSRNLARKMDEAVYGGTPEKKKDTRMVVTNADKKANTPAYQKMKAGDKRYKSADHMDEEKKPLPKNKMFRKAGNLGRDVVSPSVNDDQRQKAYDRSKKIIKTLNKANEEVEVDEAMMAGPRKDAMKKKEYSAKSGSDRATAFNIGTRRDVSVSDPKIKSRGGRTDKRTGEGDRGMGNAAKRRMKEDASMSPQEIQLQKKKAMLDRMIAQRRQQGLTKAKATESPAKAVGEATEDSLRDRRMERGGVDGNNRYDKAPGKPNTFGKKPGQKYDGMSALEKVKANIRAKHGQGAIKEDAKMAKQSDEKLAALHKQVSGSDQSLPSNQFMMKRVTKEMNRRKKPT